MKNPSYRAMAKLFMYLELCHIVPSEEDFAFLMHHQGKKSDRVQLDLFRVAFNEEVALMKTNLIEQGIIEDDT